MFSFLSETIQNIIGIKINNHCLFSIHYWQVFQKTYRCIYNSTLIGANVFHNNNFSVSVKLLLVSGVGDRREG